jgi:hypothetical protein
MWYTCQNPLLTHVAICTASSADGKTWTKNTSPVLTSNTTPQEWEAGNLFSPSVIYDGSTYAMWYTSGPVSGIGSKIGYATSTDGIAWTKDANNPILSVGSSGVWDAGGVENQCVVQSQGGYLLYYDGYGPTKTSLNYIGVAQSVATTSQTATQIYTTSTPSLQLPQPPQSTGSQSTNNTPQLALALAVIAAVVLGALFLYKRRGKQPETTEAKKVDSATKKTASGKNFCIECGSELPLKSKFCNNCGTKQP